MPRTGAWALVLVVATIGPLAGLGASAGVLSLHPTLPQVASFGAVSPFRAGVHGTVESLNWAGYAVTGGSGSVTQVTGSWVEPSVSCSRSSNYAAFWDGIDGYSSDTVEQGGTLAYCSGGHAHYYAWYEFYPAASVEITSIAVHPGDTVSVTVSYNSSTALFSVTVKDGSSSYTQTGTVSGAERTSAECIAERPEVNGRLASLAKFGTADFGADYTSTIGCGATVSGTTGSFGSFSTVVGITMVDSAGRTLSSTGSLSSDSSSFAETWVASS